MRDDARLDVDRSMLRQVPDPSAPCVRPRGFLRGLLRGVLQRHALLVVLIGPVHRADGWLTMAVGPGAGDSRFPRRRAPRAH